MSKKIILLLYLFSTVLFSQCVSSKGDKQKYNRNTERNQDQRNSDSLISDLIYHVDLNFPFGKDTPLIFTEAGPDHMINDWNYPKEWSNRFPTGIDTVYIRDTIYCDGPILSSKGEIELRGDRSEHRPVMTLRVDKQGRITFDSTSIFSILGHAAKVPDSQQFGIGTTYNVWKAYVDSAQKHYGKDYQFDHTWTPPLIDNYKFLESMYEVDRIQEEDEKNWRIAIWLGPLLGIITGTIICILLPKEKEEEVENNSTG